MALNARPKLEGTIQAAGAITELRFVGFDGNQASVQGQKCRGVARFAAAEGDWLTIIEKGSALVETGGVIAIGDDIICDAEGRAITSSGPLKIGAGATEVTSTAANGAILTGSALPERVLANALAASAAEGNFIEVLLV